MSLLVKLPSRNFLLTADAVHVRANIDHMAPCPVDLNAMASQQSIQRIKQLAAAQRFGGTDGHT